MIYLKNKSDFSYLQSPEADPKTYHQYEKQK